jgi:hypothetical protein
MSHTPSLPPSLFFLHLCYLLRRPRFSSAPHSPSLPLFSTGLGSMAGSTRWQSHHLPTRASRVDVGSIAAPRRQGGGAHGLELRARTAAGGHRDGGRTHLRWISGGLLLLRSSSIGEAVAHLLVFLAAPARLLVFVAAAASSGGTDPVAEDQVVSGSCPSRGSAVEHGAGARRRRTPSRRRPHFLGIPLFPCRGAPPASFLSLPSSPAWRRRPRSSRRRPQRVRWRTGAAARWGSRTGEEQGISGRGACRRRESSFRRAARRNRRCTGPTSRRAFQFDAKSAGFPVPVPEQKHGVRPAGPRCSKRNAKNGLQFALPALSRPQCGQSNKFARACRFWSLMFMQGFSAKCKTFGKSSSST